MNASRHKRPFVLINMAMSADGKIATGNRAVHSFGSPQDQHHLYELRATADAILCGARTLEMEGATLGSGGARFRRKRVRCGLCDEALRVVASGSASISPDAAIFQQRFSPVVLLTSEQAPKRRLDSLRAVVDAWHVCGGREIDFAEGLRWLSAEWGVRRLLGEGGGELNDGLFRAGVVDEIHLTLTPLVFGGRGSPSIADGLGFSRLPDAARFRLQSIRQHGDELHLVYRCAR